MGSTFSAVLPRGPAATRSSAPSPVQDTPLAGLVFEHDRLTRDWLVALLLDAQWRVESAADLVELDTQCRAQAFDAVLLNPLLPEVRSGEALSIVRASELNRDVLILATATSVPDGRRGGFVLHDSLLKPVQEESLVGTFSRALGPGEHSEGPVLVVDDDPAALRLAELALSRLNRRAVCVSGAEEGLIAAASCRPVLVVLDLLMPGMDGFEFITHFQRTPAAQQVPIIIWTAKTLTTSEELRLRSSVAAIVSKGAGGIVEIIKLLSPLSPRGKTPERSEHRGA